MLTTAEKGAHDITIIGGIWDYDNVNQAPNLIHTKHNWFGTLSHNNGDPNHVVTHDLLGEMGVIMTFSHVTRFRALNLTLKNPVTFSFQIAYVTHFTIENIYFDQNFGKLTAENMDGIHVLTEVAITAL